MDKDTKVTISIIAVIFLTVGIIMIHKHTHAYSTPPASVVSKALDTAEANIKRPDKDIGLDLYPKQALDIVAVESSKRTVDFIVNKMITDKFIIVNKDGISYRFKLVKKYKQPKDKK